MRKKKKYQFVKLKYQTLKVGRQLRLSICFTFSHKYHSSIFRKRKSVIVKHCSIKTGKLQAALVEDVERDNPAAHIDIPAISSMCSAFLIQEEQTYLNAVKITFCQSWSEINLGERVLQDYIRFCKTKKDFSLDFIKLCNKQMRWASNPYVLNLFKPLPTQGEVSELPLLS